MKERPILFSAPMVRAILEGRKTQTRLAMSPQPELSGKLLWWYWKPGFGAADIAGAYHSDGRVRQCSEWFRHCPYGQPGDRLWVRETFSGPHCMEASEGCAAVPPSKWGTGSRIWYWADGNPQSGDWTRPRASIHMPRWASRIDLEVTGVRVERLQDISEADARAEGSPCYVCGRAMDGCGEGDCHCFHRRASASDYRTLWGSINGPGSWDANPWVWVVEFRRVKA